MSRAWQRRPTTLAALTYVGLHLFGCNAILGIDEPEDALIDAGGWNDSGNNDAGNDNDGSVAVDGGRPITGSHARANWPMPNPVTTGLSNPQAYTVSGDGVVTDNVTGLHWQRDASSASMPWSGAETLCAQLTLAGGGFRLPSRIELLSLLDFTQDGSAIDAQAFPNTPAEGFWSASLWQGTPRSAWGVNFGFSTGVVFQDDVSHERRVRCVRSDHDDAPNARFIVSNGLVQDTATQLEWQQIGPETQVAWDVAMTQCGSLDLDGTDWRLPTIKELHTLVDEARNNPAADTTAFPGITASYYWSSSRPKSFSNLAWAVGFDHGVDVFRPTTTTAYVRCVR